MPFYTAQTSPVREKSSAEPKPVCLGRWSQVAWEGKGLITTNVEHSLWNF